MNERTQAEIQKAERISNYLGDPVWEEIQEDLRREIYEKQATVLDAAKTWEEVNQIKGYCVALNMLLHLREINDQYKDTLAEDALDV